MGDALALAPYVVAAAATAVALVAHRRLRARTAQAEHLRAVLRSVRGAAHDLNQPLGIVKGYADMLVTAPGAPQAADWARQVSEQVDRAAAAVEQVQVLARAEPPRRPLR